MPRDDVLWPREPEASRNENVVQLCQVGNSAKYFRWACKSLSISLYIKAVSQITGHIRTQVDTLDGIATCHHVRAAPANISLFVRPSDSSSVFLGTQRFCRRWNFQNPSWFCQPLLTEIEVCFFLSPSGTQKSKPLINILRSKSVWTSLEAWENERYPHHRPDMAVHTIPHTKLRYYYGENTHSLGFSRHFFKFFDLEFWYVPFKGKPRGLITAPLV